MDATRTTQAALTLTMERVQLQKRFPQRISQISGSIPWDEIPEMGIKINCSMV